MIVTAPAALARIRPVIETPPVPWGCQRQRILCKERGGFRLTEEEDHLARLEG